MRTYWRYEIKRSARLLIVLLAVCVLPLVIHCAQSSLFSTWRPDGLEVTRSVYDVFMPYVAIMMGLLAVFLPVYSYRFKMEKRSVDTWYALPIKRWKIYFVKTMVGLFLMIVPFTAAYWAGVATLAVRENYYQMLTTVPAYFALLFFGICLYGIVAFLFTRANRLVDGLVFVGGFVFLPTLLVAVLLNLFAIQLVNPYYHISNSPSIIWYTNFEPFDLSLIGGMSQSMEEFSRQFCGRSGAWEWWWFVIPAVYGALGFFGLFFSLRSDRAENAEQISSSWFGYKVLIPFYVTIATCIFNEWDGISVVIAAVLGLVAYIVYRRRVRIEKQDWLCLAGALVLGVILSLLL